MSHVPAFPLRYRCTFDGLRRRPCRPGGVATAARATTPRTVSVFTGAVDHFGAALHSAGDLNGDGYEDLVTGTDATVGSAFVYFGSEAGLPQTPSLELGEIFRFRWGRRTTARGWSGT